MHTPVWEYEGYSKEYQIAENTGGVFDLRAWQTVQISGPDAQDYLQRMSTQDFRKLSVNEIVPGLFLTGKAVPIIGGYFFKLSEKAFLFVVPPKQGELAYEHLEKFHFQENLEIENVSEKFALLGFWKKAAPAGSQQDPFRSQLKLWLGEPQKAEALLKENPQLGYHLFEFYRIEAGVVLVGKETDEKTLALEAGLDKSISEQKGCYPGQEVVERIRTYGQVNRRLARLEVTTKTTLTMPMELFNGKDLVGKLVAIEFLPDNAEKAYGIAYLKRSFIEAHKELGGFELTGAEGKNLHFKFR